MRAGVSRRSIPNIISSSRVGLAAAFVVTEAPDARLVLVGLAAATDFLDGWVARRGNWTSRAGALVDAFADRVFVLVAVSTFLFTGALSTLGYFVLIARDLATAVGFLVARAMASLRSAAFKARFPGKAVTVLQLVTLVALIKQPVLVTPLLWLVAAASAWAIWDYIFALSRARTA
jgi:phosphatidylglycerophosphate synthase